MPNTVKPSDTADLEKLEIIVRKQRQEIQKLRQTLKATAAEKSSALEEAQALTHLGSWQWDVTTNVISWSDELYRIYGLKPQERQVGFEEFMSMIHPDDRERINAAIGVSFTTGQPFEFEHRIVLKNKKERVLHGLGKVIKDSKGKPLRMVGTSQDVTDRTSSELALNRSDERFRAVTKATHDLVYDLDLSSGVIWFNEALQTEYGYAHKPEANTTFEWWTSRIHPDDTLRVENDISELLQSDQQTWHAEYRFRKHDGAYAVVRNRAFVLRDHHDKPERIVGSLLDITEAKRLDKAKDEFISLVSHQLRTPLTIIRLHGNMLTDGIAGPLKPRQQEYVTKITSASIRLIKLVGDILNISRLELNRIKIESTPTDVNQLIKTYLEELAPMAQANCAAINFKPNPDLGLAPIDATVFGEIIHNLVGNALRYACAEDGKVDISFGKEKRGYLLTVRDNGIGIPSDAQSHIFERFYRASNATNIDGEGTGLGLYLVKLFIDNAGGKIWFKSVEGKGTTFFILFPPEGMKLRHSNP